MRSKGSRFTLGVWGLRMCSLDVAFLFATVRNRSQPSATVRNRLQPSARLLYGRAYGKFCRAGHFWRFQTFRCFVSRGRHGTLWHSEVFCNVSKVVLWQAQYFCDVFRRCVAVFVAGTALWTCRVTCFLQIELAGLREVATRCRFRGRRGILWDVLKIDGTLARNIDFEVAKFRGSCENS